MAVTASPRAPQVQVSPGTAVDGEGRVIVLPDDPASARTVSLADFLGRTVNLYIVFQEVESNPQATGAADFGRWLEQPHLEVVDVQASHDFAHPPVLLAQIVLNNRSVEKLDTAPVLYSGLRLPGPGPAAPTLRTAPSGNAVFAGTLTVDTALGVGTPTPTSPLHVRGATLLDGTLTVNADTTLNGPATIPTSTLSFGSATRQMINLWTTEYGMGVQNSTAYFRTGGNFAWFQGGIHNNGELNAGTGGALQMVLKGSNLGLGTSSPNQKLTVWGQQNAGKDADSSLTYGGQVAIKGNAAQLDFIDTDGNDWAIHVNSNKMYFIRQPWQVTDLVLDGAGNVGVGTDGPATKLHVVGDTTITGGASVGGTLSFGSSARQMINLYDDDYALGVQSSTQYFRSGGHFAWYQGGVHNNAERNAGTGGTALMALHGGHLAIGTATVENSEGWNKVVDLLGTGHARFTARTATIDGRLMVHDGGFWSAPAGAIVGTRTAHPLTLGTSAAARLTVTATGNVAIGATDSAQKLMVAGPHNAGKDSQNGMTYGGQFAIKGNAPQIDFIDTDSADWAIHVNDGRMYFLHEPWSTDSLVLNSDGKVGIGTNSPRQKLDVVGNLRISSAGQLLLYNGDGSQNWAIYPEWNDPGDPDLFFNYSGNASGWASGWLEPLSGGWRVNSDVRMKETIDDLGPVLDKVLQLRPTSYRFLGANPDKPKTVGFIAQEVEELFPDMVVEKRGFKSLSYNEFAVLAIAAIQELYGRLAATEQVVNELRPAGTEPLGPPVASAVPSSGPAAVSRSTPPTEKATAKKSTTRKATRNRPPGGTT